MRYPLLVSLGSVAAALWLLVLSATDFNGVALGVGLLALLMVMRD